MSASAWGITAFITYFVNLLLALIFMSREQPWLSIATVTCGTVIIFYAGYQLQKEQEDAEE